MTKRICGRPCATCEDGTVPLLYDQESGFNYFASPHCEKCDSTMTDAQKADWLRKDNAQHLLESLEEQCAEADIDEIPFEDMIVLYEAKKKARK